MEEEYDYNDDYTQYLDFLTEEETEEEQFFFDLDFDPKFNTGFYDIRETHRFCVPADRDDIRETRNNE